MSAHPLVGKIVAPKSGGMPMTVGAVIEEKGVEFAICSWWDGKKNTTAKFPVASLAERKPIRRFALRAG